MTYGEAIDAVVHKGMRACRDHVSWGQSGSFIAVTRDQFGTHVYLFNHQGNPFPHGTPYTGEFYDWSSVSATDWKAW